MISRLAEKSLDAHIEREATITVDAPAGALGILLTGEIKPIVEGLKDESPLHLDVGVGWQLKSINGTSVAALGCEKAAEVLAKQESLPRQLIFFDPERKRAATCGEPMEPPRPYGTIVVEAPAGRLGLLARSDSQRDLLVQPAPGIEVAGGLPAGSACWPARILNGICWSGRHRV